MVLQEKRLHGVKVKLEKAGRGLSSPRALGVGIGIGLILTLGCWFAFDRWQKLQEEQEIYRQLASYMTPSAKSKYKQQGLVHRLEIARDALPLISKMRDADWMPTIESLRLHEQNEARFSYDVDLGPGSVKNCLFGSADTSQGSCSSGSYVDGQGESSVNTGFRMKFGPDAHVSTVNPALISLGSSRQVKVRGTLRIDKTETKVESPVVLVPDPISPSSKSHDVAIQNFTVGDTPVLHSTKNWDFNVTYRMPSLLAPMFDGASLLTVARLEGALQVDLRRKNPGYRAEGRVTILNHEAGHGAVHFYPGDYASLSARQLSLPVPFPGVCFNVGESIAEFDFEEQRLRLGGTMVMQSAESFRCRLRGADMGFFTRQALGGMFESARSYLGLPETVVARAHFVADLDDKIVCGNATTNGYSLLHAAFVANQENLYVWAPKRFKTSEVSLEGAISSTFRVGKDFMFSDWSFPRSSDWSCWNGDAGPKTNLFESILEERPSWIN